MFQKDTPKTIRGKIVDAQNRPVEGLRVTALKTGFASRSATNAAGDFIMETDPKAWNTLVDAVADQPLVLTGKTGEIVHYLDMSTLQPKGSELVYEGQLPVDIPGLAHTSALRSQFAMLRRTQPKYLKHLPELAKANALLAWNSTYYEELKCVGQLRRDNVLEAIFEVKQPQGFGGKRCTEGSTEWVTFWIDYTGAGAWTQVASPVPVQTHDLPGAANSSIWYAAQANFNPEQFLKLCKFANVVKVRAILSWQSPHLDPLTLPVWGNAVDAWVNLQSKPVLQIFNDFDFIPIPNIWNDGLLLNELTASLKMAQASLEAGNALLKEDRKGLGQLLAKEPNYFGAISDVPAKTGGQKALDSIIATNKIKFPYSNNDIIVGPPKIIKNFDTTFEELTCVGLAPSLDTIEATFAIKRTDGYGSDLCGPGSTEYITYYVDFGAGWEEVGTDKVRVHNVPVDAAHLPLMYASRMYVPSMRERADLCDKPGIIRVRAILSWDVDPTGMGPGYRPRFGNALTRNVEVMPKLGHLANPIIRQVSKQLVGTITATGLADGVHPFGAHLGVFGDLPIGGPTHYRLQYQRVGDPAWTNCMNVRPARKPGTNDTEYRAVTGDGWFSIAQYFADRAIEPDLILAYFDSGVLEGLHQLRIQVGDGVTASSSSNVVKVHLDNSLPSLFGFTGEIIPNLGVTVKDTAGNIKRCGKFVPGETITVWGNFADEFLAGYSLSIVGGAWSTWQAIPGITFGPVAVTAPGTLPSGAGTSGQKLLEFVMPATAEQCAYAIKLGVNDLTIVGYAGSYYFNPWGSHYVESMVTFVYNS